MHQILDREDERAAAVLMAQSHYKCTANVFTAILTKIGILVSFSKSVEFLACGSIFFYMRQGRWPRATKIKKRAH